MKDAIQRISSEGRSDIILEMSKRIRNHSFTDASTQSSNMLLNTFVTPSGSAASGVRSSSGAVSLDVRGSSGTASSGVIASSDMTSSGVIASNDMTSSGVIASSSTTSGDRLPTEMPLGAVEGDPAEKEVWGDPSEPREARHSAHSIVDGVLTVLSIHDLTTYVEGIREIVVGDGMCNDASVTLWKLSPFEQLQTLRLGDHCFRYLEELRINCMPSLEQVEIGNSVAIGENSAASAGRNCFLDIVGCPALMALKIGEASFPDWNSFHLECGHKECV